SGLAPEARVETETDFLVQASRRRVRLPTPRRCSGGGAGYKREHARSGVGAALHARKSWKFSLAREQGPDLRCAARRRARRRSCLPHARGGHSVGAWKWRQNGQLRGGREEEGRGGEGGGPGGR